MDELFTTAEPDGFKTESPIRAFADWQVQGGIAIGKGFRPSLQHLTTYLGAMLEKEGWQIQQVLIGTGDPTMIFVRHLPAMHTLHVNGSIDPEWLSRKGDYAIWRKGEAPPPPTLNTDVGYGEVKRTAEGMPEFFDTFTLGYNQLAWQHGQSPDQVLLNFNEGRLGTVCWNVDPNFRFVETTWPPEPTPVDLDMVNHPPHYNSHPSGLEAIQVIEHMTANASAAGKYLWRWDGKGDPLENLEKSIWYLNREQERIRTGTKMFMPDTGSYFRVQMERATANGQSMYQILEPILNADDAPWAWRALWRLILQQMNNAKNASSLATVKRAVYMQVKHYKGEKEEDE